MVKWIWVGSMALAGVFQATTVAAETTAYINGKVWTAHAAQPTAEAFSVSGGKILKVGTRKDILASIEPATTVVDLQGRRVLPGLIDAHSHAIFGGLALLSPNMHDAQVSLPELEKRLRTWSTAQAAGADVPLVISGVNPALWADPEELGKRFDRAEWSSKPLVLMGSDYHTAWVNRAMLKRAGIDAGTVAALSTSERHTVGANAEGAPNGLLFDAGLDRVTVVLPKPSASDLLAAGKVAVQANNRLGITAWMDPAANAGPGEALFVPPRQNSGTGILPAYAALAKSGALTAHVAALLVANPQSRAEDLDALERVRKQYRGLPNLGLPGIKIFADGVLEYPAQSAALLEPYRNSGQRGELLIDPEKFSELVSAADARGWLVHVHALGDRAVREALNAFDHARSRRDSGIRHSITHLQRVNPADFPRLKKLGVMAVMQLQWAEVDNYLLDLVKPYISETDFMAQYPARSLSQHGAVIAGASDWPISSANPWHAIHNAMTRGGPGGGLSAAERMDRPAMLRAYTIHAAEAIGLEQRIGSLQEGKQADFIVLDRDVLDVGLAELRDSVVLATYFAGRRVYAAE